MNEGNSGNIALHCVSPDCVVLTEPRSVVQREY